MATQPEQIYVNRLWLAVICLGVGAQMTGIGRYGPISLRISVLALTHKSLDDVGNVTETHQFEAVHDDSPLGIDLTAADDYIRRSVYPWFDTANRRTAMGDYGSGDTATGAGNWDYASVPSRPASAPTASSDTVLLTTYSYGSITGRLEVDTIWSTGSITH